MATEQEKAINAALAELEVKIDDALDVAQRCDAAKLPFPSSSTLLVVRVLCTVIRKQQVVMHDMRERIVALERDK